MPIITKTVRLDIEGNLKIPSHLMRAAGIRPADRLEIRLTGGAQAPYLLLRKRRTRARVGGR